MKRFDFNRATVANALVWAAMMIASALLMKDSDNGQTMILLMIAGWFVTNGLVGNSAATAHGRCAGKQGD